MEDSFFLSLFLSPFFLPMFALRFGSNRFLGMIDFRIDLYDFFIFGRIYFCGCRGKNM